VFSRRRMASKTVFRSPAPICRDTTSRSISSSMAVQRSAAWRFGITRDASTTFLLIQPE
jgi:hypothetical protein